MWGLEMGLNAVVNLPSFVILVIVQNDMCQRISGVYKCLAGLMAPFAFLFILICVYICIFTYL